MGAYCLHVAGRKSKYTFDNEVDEFWYLMGYALCGDALRHSRSTADGDQTGALSTRRAGEDILRVLSLGSPWRADGLQWLSFHLLCLTMCASGWRWLVLILRTTLAISNVRDCCTPRECKLGNRTPGHETRSGVATTGFPPGKAEASTFVPYTKKSRSY